MHGSYLEQPQHDRLPVGSLPLMICSSKEQVAMHASTSVVSNSGNRVAARVWPKIIPVAMEMPMFYVNFSSPNYPNLNDENLGP